MMWPFMLKRTHARAITAEMNMHFDLRRNDRDRYQILVDREYARARDEGRRQVHTWAVEVNSAVFYGQSPFSDMRGTQRPRLAAALQEAEAQFSPARTILEIETQKEN